MGISFPVHVVYADGSHASFTTTLQSSLLLAAMRNNVYIRHECGGKAQCGMCRVKVISGKAAPKEARETAVLERLNAKPDERLACQLFAMAPLLVQVPYNQKLMRFEQSRVQGGKSMETLHEGLTGIRELVVEEKHTAQHLGSGGVPVFATPMMILTMEEAALNAVDHLLEPNQVTVGYHLDVTHLAATPLGMKVRAEAKLVKIDGKMLHFTVEAYDEKEKIGEGTHIRAIIDITKFKEKMAKKAGSA